MNEVYMLTKRTIKLYLKNPLSILFSFIYMLLFIILISMFLGDYLTKGMIDVYSNVKGLNISSIKWLVNSTSMAGVIMINCVLVPLNVLQIMVDDIDSNRLDSFLVSSATREKLVLGYWLAPFIIGVLMNLLGLFISEVFIVVLGGSWLTISSNIQMSGLIIINTFSATSIIFFVAQLIRKTTIYSTFTGLMSTVIGFVTGAFLPIGIFPEWIQKLMLIVPAHSGATMMRSVMTKDALNSVFHAVPDQIVENTKMKASEIVEIYTKENGISYFWGDYQITFPIMLSIAIGSGTLFIILSIVLMKRTKK